MTTLSIAKPQPQVKTPETPKARNRRLLLQTWQRSVRVLAHWGDHYTVGTATRAHECHTWTDSDGARHETCNCEWGTRQGTISRYNRGTRQATEVGQPCGHILVMRWARIPADLRAAILAKDADMAGVLGPVVAAQPVGFSPIIVTPTRRRERSVEAW